MAPICKRVIDKFDTCWHTCWYVGAIWEIPSFRRSIYMTITFILAFYVLISAIPILLRVKVCRNRETQEGRRSPFTSPVVKPYGLPLDWGRPQAQSKYNSHRAGGDKLSVAQMLVPPAPPGQDQRVIRVIHKASVWGNGTSKHRVVDDDS
jgi:hypothetical protein